MWSHVGDSTCPGMYGVPGPSQRIVEPSPRSHSIHCARAVAVDPGVSTVSAADATSLVGQVAAADLVAGSLLAPGQVTAAAPPGPDEVLVPLPVSAERLPASGLSAGDRLLVVDTPAVAADPPSTAPESIEATVARLGAPDLNGVSVIDVVVAEADGPALAARAATGRFALVLQSRGEAP